MTELFAAYFALRGRDWNLQITEHSNLAVKHRWEASIEFGEDGPDMTEVSDTPDYALGKLLERVRDES